MKVTKRQTCRLCGSNELTPILDLGKQKLASVFVGKENEKKIPTRAVPLELVRCNPEKDENACGLVQLKHTFPGELMYSDYWYESGINHTMKKALEEIAKKSLDYVKLKKNDVIIDIGCNDGTLLESFKKITKEVCLVGFDPANNFKNLNNESYIRINDYFNKKAFITNKQILNKKAKIITSIAMFYDLEDPVSFAQDIFDLMEDDGIWILQMADLPNMLLNNMFDNICHEHLTYFHIAPMEYLLKKCNLKLINIEKNNINGSSYRFFIKKDHHLITSETDLENLNRERLFEFNLGLDTQEPFEHFKSNIERNKNELLFFLNEEKKKGKIILVYGASTKGNVLLQYCGINEKLISYAVERNPRKFGSRTLGTNLQIISEEEGRKMKPDYFLVLPYHFIDEMLLRERQFVERGGKFILPVPFVKTLP